VDRLSTSLKIEVPANWYHWDPQDAIGTAVRELDERIVIRPALEAARQTILALLLRYWRDATDQQAVAAAALVEPANEAALVASFVAVETERVFPNNDYAEIDRLVATLSPPSPFDIRPRTVEPVELPAGRAVRLVRLGRTDGAGPGESEVVVLMVQHWLPIPGEATMLVLEGSTPCLHAADELEAAFDRVARSLAFESVPE
jgi:hypothetical protein